MIHLCVCLCLCFCLCTVLPRVRQRSLLLRRAVLLAEQRGVRPGRGAGASSDQWLEAATPEFAGAARDKPPSAFPPGCRLPGTPLSPGTVLYLGIQYSVGVCLGSQSTGQYHTHMHRHRPL